jgi:inner membrane protein
LDNLTHSLTGLALARAGLDRVSRGATLALVLASNLPDVDLVSAVGGTTNYLEHHRGVSHGVVGAPLLALALALLVRATLRGSRFGPLLLCSLVGVVGHVFMDVWTSYGTRVLSPFDRRWLTWDLVFIVDPWILVLLLATALLSRKPERAPRIASTALGLMLAYVGARAVLHAQALDQALAQLSGRELRRIAALPAPVDPFTWRVVADTGDAYWTGTVALRGRSAPLVRRPKRAEDALVAHARQDSEVAAVFLDFSTFPWLEVQSNGAETSVVWRDLRFEIPGREAFAARVTLAPDGRIVRQEFHY